MTWEAWFTLGVLVMLVVVFASERLAPVTAMGAAVVVLYLVGVVTLGEAFTGFSNSAPVTVAALYVIAGAADITGALSAVSRGALGDSTARSERRSLARLGTFAAGSSALMANTPLVALMAPRVEVWARRRGLSPSRFLMPLSFAAVLGGVITILGTSTNLVVNGFLEEFGEDPFTIFAITPVGLPVAVVGVVLLVLVAPVLLPSRTAPGEDLASAREFSLEMIVEPESPIVGQTVGEANLRNLQGVYLIEIERDRRRLSPVGPDELLQPDDRLVFAGNVDRVVDLQRISGLVMAEEHHFSPGRETDQRFYEVVVADTGVLAGSTLKQVGFRDRFGAAVIAMHRAGERLGGKLGDVRVRGGDVLLVVGNRGFADRVRESGDFLLVAPMEQATPLRRRGTRLVEIATVAMIVLAATGLVDLPKAALGAALALVVIGVITPSEARRSINLDIILMIAFSFGLGAAVATSGLAAEAASALVDVTDPLGDVGILAVILVATLVSTEVLSNNAAAAVMLPIAAATSAEAGVSLTALAVGILVMASCSFLTPIGYQTNTMVFGMGGYRFSDFSRLGAPLTAVTFVVTLIAIPIAFPL